MKHRLLSICAVLCLLLAGTSASAKDLNGRFGVGGGTTLLGNPGILVKYNIGNLSVGLLTGYARVSVEQQVGDKTGDDVSQGVDSSLRITFNAARARHTNLYLGGGFTFGNYTHKDAQGTENSASEMGFELLLGVEHFFGNHFSLSFETGMPIRMAGDDGMAIGVLSSSTAPGVYNAKGSWSHFGAVAPGLAGQFTFYF